MRPRDVCRRCAVLAAALTPEPPGGRGCLVTVYLAQPRAVAAAQFAAAASDDGAVYVRVLSGDRGGRG
jgi:uncharacterized protein YbjT (DUF2867 family)